LPSPSGGAPDAGHVVLDPAGPRPAEEHLHLDVASGQALDRALAEELRRPDPGARPLGSNYLRRLRERASLSPEDERRLVLAVKRGGPGARADLVDAFMPMIAAMARPYAAGGEIQRVELLQEGVVGLLRALERYEPERGVPFWGYATWWVRQAMQQLVAELARPAVLSDRALRQLARLRRAHAAFVQTQGREPTRAELARRAGLEREQVDALLGVDGAPRSLDAPVAAHDGRMGTLGDVIADPAGGDAYERVLSAIEADELHALLSGLSARERAILRARYGLDGDEQSLRQIGLSLGVSAERVRQLEQRALGKLASMPRAA